MDNEVIKKLIDRVATKKTKDYTYIIIFFLIFSFFVFFAIRPSLITALSLSKQEGGLRGIDSSYEKDILSVLTIQSELQTYQNKLSLLQDALPEKPQINKLLSDLQDNSQRNSINIDKVDLNTIKLSKDNRTKLQTIEMNVQVTSSYDNFVTFLNDFSKQRRIKSVENIDIISGDSTATSSKDLKINFKIIGYYL